MGVIVPVFNRPELLRCTAASLRMQTVANAEFVLVDDRSDEPVWRYLQSLPARDARFRVLRKPDNVPRGCQASRNLGFESCRAAAVVFLDSDDLLAPECLEERYAALLANPEVDLIVGRQAVFSNGPESLRWVNIPRPGVPDLDRFLDLGNPVDVPWVNGGVMIRASRLREAGIRWQSQFHWDDVAFHFECLASGMHARWMEFSGAPDAYYRMHDGERFGQVLHTPGGLRNAGAMFHWMGQTLLRVHQWTEPRRQALARSYFHACVLRAIDAGGYRLASELLTGAVEDGLLQRREMRRLRIYRTGRRCLRGARRATYYWNRLARRVLLADFFQSWSGTYGTVAPTSPEAVPALESLLRSTTASSRNPLTNEGM